MARTSLAIALTLVLIPALRAGDGLLATAAGTGAPGSAGVGGPATSAQLNSPVGLAPDAGGNLFIADYGNNRVVRVDAASRTLTLAAGNGQNTSTGDGGPAAQASLNGPAAVALDAAGNLYIAEYRGGYIRKVDAQSGIISTIAGNGSSTCTGDDGPATRASLCAPASLALDSIGNVYVGQFGNSVRRVDAATGIITTMSTGALAPTYLALDNAGNLFVSDAHRILRVAAGDGSVTTVAGNGVTSFTGDGVLAVNSGAGTNAMPIGIDSGGNLFIADMALGRIRRVDAATGMIFTVAGNGTSQSASSGDGAPATAAIIGWPAGFAVTPDGTLLYAEPQGNRIRQVNLLAPSAYTASYASSNPAIATPGQSVTLTAAVTSAGPGSDPTGSVTFRDSLANLMGVAPVANGIAFLTLAAPPAAGTYTYSAAYSGDSLFANSVSPPATLPVQSASKASTTVSLYSTQNPTTPNAPIPYIATVTASGSSSYQAVGSVQLLDGATVVAVGMVLNGSSQVAVPLSTVGTHSLTAVYSGDLNFLGSTSPVLIEVVKNMATGYLALSPNPSTAGSPVILSATVFQSAATGSIEFWDYGTSGQNHVTLGTVPLVNGKATFTTSSLSPGTHNLNANYFGDANYVSFSSAYLPQVVNAAGTSVTLASTQNPTMPQQALSIIATVTPAAGSATPMSGTVQFLDGSTVLSTGSLQNGTTQAAVSFSTLGVHSLTAVYSGDSNYLTSASAVFSQAVKNPATIAIASGLNPSAMGSPVTFTATVFQSPATGTVEFADSTNGTVSLGIVPLAGGRASLSVSSLSAGTHSIVANYSGDANYVSSGSSILPQIVKPATATSVSAPSGTPVYGQPVSFTALVLPAAATGPVQFFDSGTPLGSIALANGTAVLTVPSLPVGLHSITAAYGGDSTYFASASAAWPQVVGKAATTAVLTSSLNPSSFGQSVTFTARVSPGAATGTVLFVDGAVSFGTAAITGGTASIAISTLPPDTHSIFLVYSGDANYATSTSSALTQTISKTPAKVALTSSPNPATVGQTVTLVAVVSPATATGLVQFFEGGFALLGTVTVSGGSASLTLSPQTYAFSVGTHSINAVYCSDANNAVGMSAVLTQTIFKAPTSVTLASSSNPSIQGRSVTFAATVIPGPATGTVQFLDGSTVLGNVTISGGSAALALSSLAMGAHSITAVYSGDGNNNPSTSLHLTQTVSAPPPGAPANLTAEAKSSRQIDLDWRASPTHGVTYNVYSAATSGFMPSASNRIASGITGDSYSDSGLPHSTTRYYLVTAQTSSSESAPANQASATTRR